MKQNLIVLMGGPGAGKGTFAKMLRADNNYKYVETGAMLRQMPPESEIGRLIAGGNLVPDSALFDMIAPHLSGDQDILLDGFPRTIGQAQWVVNNYADKFNVHILYINVPTDIILKRLNKRLNEGSTRADDANPEIVRHRIETFEKTTMPAIEWLRNADGIVFSDVDASGEVSDNYNNIKHALDK
ncbi:MAG: nucleoside monophosphate kinase [Alphaproteobacteria bacterium]|nr:nucleoside monophosphate kinase [Alphaproteobacteria bacterium]